MQDYKIMKAQICRALRSFDFDYSTLEDICHDTYVRYLELPQKPNNPSAWLCRSARNRAIDEIRRKRNSGRETIEDCAEIASDVGMDGYDGVENSLDATYLLSRVDDQLDLMIIKAYYEEGSSLEDVSHALKIPLNTIKVRKHRALKRMFADWQTSEVG